MKRTAFWTLIVLGVVAGYVVIKSAPDIVRYIKISRM
jgi:hypothetical protein